MEGLVKVTPLYGHSTQLQLMKIMPS